MENVIHTCNVVYGSYSQDDVKVYCDEDDDMSVIKAKVRRQLDLNFLPMAHYSVKIISTRYVGRED